MLKKIDNGVNSETCVVLLHGFGADEYDLFDLNSLFSGAHVVSFQGPVDLSTQGYLGGRAWFPLDFTPDGIEYDIEGLEKAIQLLTKEVKVLRGRFKNLYLCGFSQGAILTHALFLKNEVDFEGVAGLSGRYNESFFDDALKVNVEGKPVFLSHGTQDEVIPISSGREIYEFYRASEVDLTAKEYEMGHGIDLKCQKDLSEWFKNL